MRKSHFFPSCDHSFVERIERRYFIKHTMEQQPIPANVVQQYRELLAECQKMQGKISELEVDRAEHVLVEETLQPLDPSRRAFRLVGECLVERTVEEVLPTVVANRENVRNIVVPLFHLTLYYLFSLILFLNF